MNAVLNFLMNFPKSRLVILLFLTVFSFALIAFFAYAAITLWREDVDTPDDPVPMTLEEAVESSKTDGLWVALQDTEGLRWNCSTIYYNSVKQTDSEWMDVVISDRAKSVVIVVTIKELLACDQLKDVRLSGELNRLSKRDFDELDTAGQLSQYPQTATFLKLCTYCNPNTSNPPMIGLSLFCMVGSVLMTVYGLHEVRGTRKAIRNKDSRQLIPEVPPGPIGDEDLMDVFFFTPSDLATNMAGYLTPGQKVRLVPRWQGFVKSLLLLLIMGLGIIAYSVTGLESDPDLNRKYAIAGMIFIALVLIGTVLDLYGTWKLRRGKVSVVCGPVTLKIKTFGDAIEYRATIEGKTFFLSPQQYALLIEGRVYYFYYAGPLFGYTGGKELLSVRRS